MLSHVAYDSGKKSDRDDSIATQFRTLMPKGPKWARKSGWRLRHFGWGGTAVRSCGYHAGFLGCGYGRSILDGAGSYRESWQGASSFFWRRFGARSSFAPHLQPPPPPPRIPLSVVPAASLARLGPLLFVQGSAPRGAKGRSGNWLPLRRRPPLWDARPHCERKSDQRGGSRHDKENPSGPRLKHKSLHDQRPEKTCHCK